MLVQGQGVPCHNYYTRSIWSGLVLLGELWEFAHSGTQARIVIEHPKPGFKRTSRMVK